jgi:hypothetical protein
MNKLITLALSLVVLNACAAQTMEEEEPLAKNESALISTGTGGGGLGYSCDGALCTCTGDVDCNDMFSDGICGPIASCDDTNYPPTCQCLKFLRTTTTVKTSITTVTTKATLSP